MVVNEEIALTMERRFECLEKRYINVLNYYHYIFEYLLINFKYNLLKLLLIVIIIVLYISFAARNELIII